MAAMQIPRVYFTTTRKVLNILCLFFVKNRSCVTNLHYTEMHSGSCGTKDVILGAFGWMPLLNAHKRNKIANSIAQPEAEIRTEK